MYINTDNMKYICELSGCWTWSEIYFDKENDCFFEKRYHEEYLDTGTKCDGVSKISDSELWDKLVKEVSEEGIAAYLDIRGCAPAVTSAEKGINLCEFQAALAELRRGNPPIGCYDMKVGSVLVVYDAGSKIIGVLSNTDKFYFYIDLQVERKKRGFHTQEEALSFALKQVKEHFNRQVKKAPNTTASATSDTAGSPVPDTAASHACEILNKSDFYNNPMFKKKLRNVSIFCYFIAGCNMLFSILSEPMVMMDAIILLCITLGMHLGKSKICAVLLLILGCIELIIGIVITGGPNAFWWMLAGVWALRVFKEADKDYANYIIESNAQKTSIQ